VIWALAGVALAQGVVDLNTATLQELDRLPGIGPAKAEALIVWRTERGPCRDLSELEDAPGIGAATRAALVGRAVCGEAGGRSVAPVLTGLAPEALPGAININRATVVALDRLPGINSVRAAAIVADRAKNGPFERCADLVRVAGVGPATVANLGRRCVSESEPRRSAPPPPRTSRP